MEGGADLRERPSVGEPHAGGDIVKSVSFPRDPRASCGQWSLRAGGVIDGDLSERVCPGLAGVLWVLDLVKERCHSRWS